MPREGNKSGLSLVARHTPCDVPLDPIPSHALRPAGRGKRGGRRRVSVCRSPELGVCPADLYLATLPSQRSAHSLRIILIALTRDYTTHDNRCPWHAPTYADLVRLWASIQTRGLAVRSRKLYRCAVRGVLRQLHRLGEITGDELLRLYEAVPAPRGTSAPAGRALLSDQIDATFAVLSADRTVRGVRNRAVVATLYATGVRVAELCGLLEPDDVRDEGHVLAIRGKGDRPRLAFVADLTARDYLTAWRRARGAEVGWLFCALRSTAFVDPSRPLRPAQVGRIVAVTARTAGIGHVTPHDWRRTYATLLADHVPLDVLSRLLGHASIETTRLYVRRDTDTLQRAAALLPPLQPQGGIGDGRNDESGRYGPRRKGVGGGAEARRGGRGRGAPRGRRTHAG